MSTAALVMVLVAGVIVLTPLANRVSLPQPVLLTVFGLALALLPFTPELTNLDPTLVLPVVLPPLLFAATQRTTAREFRDHAGAVLLLAVGLTVATVAVVAVVAHAAGLPWAASWVLGAVVSPPDPVAATAVARRLRLPHRLVTVLEGEGMFNDATALVAYKVAVAAAVTGSLSAGGTAVQLVLALVVGIGTGLLLGWLTRTALAAIRDAYSETTVTVLAPFLAYLGAERLDGSGVLAVLVLGLFLRSYGHEATTSRGWLLGRSVWSYADFLITSLLFSVLGFELVKVIQDSRPGSGTVGLTVAVVLAVVLFRPVWLFPSSWFARRRASRRDYPSPVGWQETTVVSWAGMRGVVTVATALALPLTVDAGGPFPHRDAVVVVALVCVLVTLVVQGLTLAPLVRRLGVGEDHDDRAEVIRLRLRAAQAGLDVVQASADVVPEEVRRAALLQYDGFLAAQTALDEARSVTGSQPDGHEQDKTARQLQDLLDRAASAERDLVLEARRNGEVSSASADEVLRDVEGRALRDID